MTYEEFLLDCLTRRDDVVVLTAENRAAMRNLPARAGGRFIDFGIAEMTMTGAAAGLALRGRVPIAHALATFLTMRAFEFVRTDVGIPALPVKLVGAVAGFLSEANGPTHQAIEDVALMRGIPPMRVFCPADERDLVLGMTTIVEDPAPWYVRYNALPAAADHAPFAVGRAETYGNGADVAILTYGFLLREALRARELLAAEGIAARVIHMRTLKPVDTDALLGAAHACPLLAIVEDHFVTGGLVSIAAEVFLASGVAPRVLPIALPDRWFAPGLLDDVLAHEGFTGAQLAARIRSALEQSPSSPAPRIRSTVS